MSQEKLTKQEFVEQTIELFNEYQSEQRAKWGTGARENELFRYGAQWTEDQARELEARGQIPIVINRIDPAVELAKSMLTSNTPTFRFISVEDSDTQVAQALNGLVEYIWRISDGRMEFASSVEDFIVKGMGAWIVYVDRYADNGKGEVKFKAVNPLDIYIDPNSRDRNCQDAKTIIISREYPKESLKLALPEYKNKIKKASSPFGLDSILVDSVGTIPITFAGEYHNHFDEDIRAYERYDKVWVNRYRVYEQFSGRELILDEEQFMEYLERPCWVIQDSHGDQKLITEENEAQDKTMAVMQEYQMMQEQYQEMLQQAQMDPQLAEQFVAQGIEPPKEPEVVKTTLGDIMDNTEQIQIVELPLQRIKKTVVFGDQFIEETILPTDKYPVIIFMNKHTGSPYPLSDVDLSKDQQRFINKMKSLIVAHASAATNVKVMIPLGSDVAKIKEQWAQPNAVIEVDFDSGIPVTAQPLPLPNELYTNVAQAKEDIDYQFGLFEAMHGNANVAPDTARGIMMLDEFGHRRIKVKQDIIEHALEMLGTVVLHFIQDFYVAPKIFRLLKPNNSITEFAINKRLYDDGGVFTGTIENNVALGRYDVYVEGGSMLPTNKYAQLSFYLDSYEKGLIDRNEVLKKTEIFDKEGVLQRIDENEQLKQMVEELQQQVQALQGDIQTRERELFHTKMDNAVMRETNKMKDLTRDVETDKILAAGKISHITEAAAEAAKLEKDKIAMEERNKVKQKTKGDKK